MVLLTGYTNKILTGTDDGPGQVTPVNGELVVTLTLTLTRSVLTWTPRSFVSLSPQVSRWPLPRCFLQERHGPSINQSPYQH